MTDQRNSDLRFDNGIRGVFSQNRCSKKCQLFFRYPRCISTVFSHQGARKVHCGRGDQTVLRPSHSSTSSKERRSRSLSIPGTYALESFLYIVVGFLVYDRFDKQLRHPLDFCLENTFMGKVRVFNFFTSTVEKMDAILELSHGRWARQCDVLWHLQTE